MNDVCRRIAQVDQPGPEEVSKASCSDSQAAIGAISAQHCWRYICRRFGKKWYWRSRSTRHRLQPPGDAIPACRIVPEILNPPDGTRDLRKAGDDLARPVRAVTRHAENQHRGRVFGAEFGRRAINSACMRKSGGRLSTENCAESNTKIPGARRRGVKMLHGQGIVARSSDRLAIAR